MEQWNLYNRQGEQTEKIHVRGEPIPPGYYHMVVHIWFRDEEGRFLIQQRARTLDAHPGVWATTGGSATVGESSVEAVIRETTEELELNLVPEDLQLINRLWRRDYFVDLYLADVHAGFAHDFRSSPEVDAVAFKSPSELARMIEAGTFFRYAYDIFDELGIRGS